MNILFKSLHNLDLMTDAVVGKEIHEDFESYIKEYITFSTKDNDTKRDFKIRDENTTVIRCIIEIINGAISGSEGIMDYADSIAKKLMAVEKDVQQDVAKLGIQVQKGSILQALIKDDEGYKYIIAKVEHTEFFEVERFCRDIGFPSENKRVWKSVVISWNNAEEGLTFAGAKVYAKSGERYWTHSFLEMDPANSDEINTQRVYSAVNKVLTSTVRDQSPADYTRLQNAVITALQSERQINYNDMIQSIFGAYEPIEEKLDIQTVTNKLQALPDSAKFDTQFNSAPHIIKKVKKRRFQISSSIELLLKEGIEDLDRRIKSIRTPEGERFIQVLCDSEEAFRAFSEKNE